MSYEVITPSACRAIFEAIYWKPEIKWVVKQIEVLNPIDFTHIQRCEVANIASTKKHEIIAEDFRQLRSSVVLRDVRYRVSAELKLNDKCLIVNAELRGKELAKHNAIFLRRAMRGQCFTQPYLGCREFACRLNLVSVNEQKLLVDSNIHYVSPIAVTKDLGRMFYDMDFTNPDNPQPLFFEAKMIEGVVKILDFNHSH